MTSYVQLESGLFSSRPIELYRWILGTPLDILGVPGASAYEEDLTGFADIPALEAAGWAVDENSGTVIGVTDDGVEFHTIGSGPYSGISKVITGLTPGDTVAGEYDWTGVGHWFEPIAMVIDNGSTTKANGNNRLNQTEGTVRTGGLVVPPSGEITMTVHMQGGIGHGVVCNDFYWIPTVRLILIDPADIPEETQEIFGHTSSKKQVTFNGEIYVPKEITRGQISLGGEDRPGALTVNIPADCDVGELLKEGLAYAPLRLQVIRLQREALDDPAYIFDGDVISHDGDENAEMIAVQCSPTLAALQESVPHELVQKDQCPWQTGDPHTCKVDLLKFTFTGTVASISSDDLTIEVTGAAAFVPDLVGATTLSDMFVGGIIRKGPYQGAINAQNLDFVVLDESLPTLIVGDEVELVAGDDRTKFTCKNKFQNIDNFGAFSDLPAINPAYGQNLRP